MYDYVPNVAIDMVKGLILQIQIEYTIIIA